MANDKVPVTVFHGGFLRTFESFEYVGGRVTVIDINLKAGKLCNIIDAINSLGEGEIDCLFYNIPTMPLKEGLRELCSDGDVVDMLNHHLHTDIIDLYVEYVDEYYDHAYNRHISSDDVQVGIPEAVDDEEHLVDVEHSSDDDDEDLVEARQKVKEYSMRHRFGNGNAHEVNHLEEASIDPELEDEDEDEDENIFDDDVDEDYEHHDLLSYDDHQNALTLPIELPHDNAGVEDTGYQSEYHSSDEQGSLHSDVDERGVGDVIVHARQSRFPRYNRHARDPTFIVGMTFEDATEFKEAIVRQSIAEHRTMKYITNTSVRVRAKCAQVNCKWMIYGGIDSRTNSFHLKRFVDEHTCNISFINKRVNSSYLAKHFMSLISAMPKISAPELKKLVREQVGVNVTVSQCRRTKLLVMKKLQGNYKKEYGKMWDYLAELRNSCPTSTFKMKVERPVPDALPFFDRAYFCFDACRKGFLAGCRPIIGLDGCFLKGLIQGELLCAVGRDANNQMYPIACRQSRE